MCSSAALCEMSPSRPPMDSIIFSTRMARSSPDFPQARFPGVVLHGIHSDYKTAPFGRPAVVVVVVVFVVVVETVLLFIFCVALSLCTVPCDLHSTKELLRKGTQVFTVAS